MVIDTHTHIFPDEVAKKAIPNLLLAAQGTLKAHTEGTQKSLLESMERSGVDYSVVLTIATSPDQGKGILKWIKNASKTTNKLIFFGSVHPQDSDYKELLNKISGEGLKGLKFHPQYQNYPVDSKEVYPIYEEALKKGLILHFHAGFDIGFPRSDYASAQRFRNLLTDFPQMNAVLAHAGGFKEWHQVYSCLHDKKAYFDISFALDDMLNQGDISLVKLFKEKEDFFVFGTDSPWRDQKEDLEQIQGSWFFSEEQKRKLLSENALKLLGNLK